MSDEEVVDRWRQVYAVPSVLAALPDRKERIATWRARLCSISWFMRAINEPLARRANKEDDCTGRFWEGRFKSQALLDWPAVLRCMAYVDLNPIRAGLATRPENSHFTSIRARVNDKPHVLVPLGSRQPGGLPISFSSYFGLVAATGHCVARGKHGKVSAELAPILTHLDIDGETWMLSMQKRRRWFRVIGTAEALQRCAAVLGFGGLRNASVI